MDSNHKTQFSRLRALHFGASPKNAVQPKMRGFFSAIRHLILTYLDLTYWKWNSIISRWLDWVDNK